MREKELKMKDEEMQLQLKLKELKLQQMMPSKSDPPPSTSTSFDVSRKVWLVLQFHEEEVYKFFLYFEKLATILHWPSEAQRVVGKVRKVYSAMSVEESVDCEVV